MTTRVRTASEMARGLCDIHYRGRAINPTQRVETGNFTTAPGNFFNPNHCCPTDSEDMNLVFVAVAFASMADKCSCVIGIRAIHGARCWRKATTATDGGSADIAGANICHRCIHGGPRQRAPNSCLAPLSWTMSACYVLH